MWRREGLRSLLVGLAVLAGGGATPAAAGPPSAGTAFRSVTLDGVALGTAFGSLRSTVPTIAFDPASNLFHLWVLTSDSGLSLGMVRHATSAGGIRFTSTGNLRYAGGDPFVLPATPFGFDAYTQAPEPPVIFPKVATAAAVWQLVLWTPNNSSGIGDYGDYNYNHSVNAIGADPATLDVTHLGPIGIVPTNGIAGQSTGPWGLVAGYFYYQSDLGGQLGRAALTETAPGPFPDTKWTGPWAAAAPGTQVKDLINTIPGFSYCGVADGDPQVYPRNHGSVIDNGGGTLGGFYTLRYCATEGRVNKQIYYVESADVGATWADPVAVFPDGNAVTIDTGPTTQGFSDPEVVPFAGTRLVYFNTAVANGDFVVATNVACGTRWVGAGGTDQTNLCLDAAAPCATAAHATAVACPTDAVTVLCTDDCSALSDACNAGVCVAPNVCGRVPRPNGTACDDGDVCSQADACADGTCTGTADGDTDGDGYCNAWEQRAGCNPNDGREIPALAPVFLGGGSAGAGDVLVTLRAPRRAKVRAASDASCAAGVCSESTGFCVAGRVGDPCTANADCTPAPATCRVVVTWAATSDLQLRKATLKPKGKPRQDLLAAFQPATAGCSRKVDVTLTGRKTLTLRLKARGTITGRRRNDTDRVTLEPR